MFTFDLDAYIKARKVSQGYSDRLNAHCMTVYNDFVTFTKTVTEQELDAWYCSIPLTTGAFTGYSVKLRMCDMIGEIQYAAKCVSDDDLYGAWLRYIVQYDAFLRAVQRMENNE